MIFFIFIISIIIHECMHIIIGFLFGYKLKSFRFVPFGTAIEFEEMKDCNILKNICIYLSGPISNFIISIIVFNINIKFNFEIFYTNLILGIFNLLPLNPLDGGKILKEILRNFFDNKKANIISYKVNKLFLCIFTFLYSIFIVKIKNIFFVFLLGYLWYLDIKEYRKIIMLKNVYDIIENSKSVI